MKTVKDISKITGVSIRTLRYYDEIGLLKPTQLTEAGYRLYDNKALEKLQEIMFLQATGNTEEIKREQDDINKIYLQFMTAKETDNTALAHSAVEQLAKSYKELFALDNARNILLDLANEYLQNQSLAKACDSQFGNGCSQYVAHAIRQYYGV